MKISLLIPLNQGFKMGEANKNYQFPLFLKGGQGGFASSGARKMTTASPPDAGFSLLEVLVATTLMGLVLVVLVQIMTTVLRAQEAVRGHTQALVVAEKILQEHSQLKNLEAGSFQGQDGRYGYRLRLTPQYEVSEAKLNRTIRCYLIQVTVFWEERGRTKSLDLQTVRTAAFKS